MIMQSQKMMMLRASAACLPCRVLRACEERSMSHLCRTHREHARIIPMRDSATQNQIYFLVKLSFSLISICQIEATLSRPKTMRGQFSVTSRMKRRSSRNGNLVFLLLLVVQVGHGFGFIASQKVISSDRALLIQKSKAISKDNDESDRSHLVFPGGGIFFNWQGGVITYLREQGYDLTSCDFVGSSAGSLTATFAATGVDFYEATDLALKMASKYDVWDRKDGLKGVLRPMIEEWLQTLVPSSLDIDEIDGRLSLLVTPVPLLWEKQKISSFTDRNDLIECNLASIYLPFFSDGRLWSNFRNKPYIDGNFLSKGTDYKPSNARKSSTVFLNWKKDPVLASKGEEDLVATLSPEDVWGLVERGKAYAEIMESKGKFRGIRKL